MENEQPNGKWHLDRRVPIGLFFAIAVQTLVFAYYVGEMSETLQQTVAKVAQIEARESIRQENINSNATNIAVINQNLLEIQRSLNRIEKNQEVIRSK